MSNVKQIRRNMEILRQEIRLAQREYTSERELELMYKDLDIIEEELYQVQTISLNTNIVGY